MLNVRVDTAFYLSRHVPSETFEFESNPIRGVIEDLITPVDGPNLSSQTLLHTIP